MYFSTSIYVGLISAQTCEKKLVYIEISRNRAMLLSVFEFILLSYVQVIKLLICIYYLGKNSSVSRKKLPEINFFD